MPLRYYVAVVYSLAVEKQERIRVTDASSSVGA